MAQIQKYGPYGANEKQTFNFVLQNNEVITRVRIESGFVADFLGFEVLDTCGNYKTFWTNGNVMIGKLDNKGKGKEGDYHEFDTVSLNGERITQISGFVGDYNGERHVVQLFIHTDTFPRGYGPYGKMNTCTNLKAFVSPFPSSAKIVGFFGTQGSYLRSIGVAIQQ